MKHQPQMEEGPTAFARFDSTMTALLAVPRSEMLRREAEYRKQSASNPNRRGPKPKAKRRASRAPRA